MPPAQTRGARPGFGLLLGLLAAAFAWGLAAAVLVRHAGGPDAAPASPPAPSARAEGIASQPLPRVVGRNVNDALARLSQLDVRTTLQFRATTSPTGMVVAQRRAGGAAHDPQVLLLVDVGSPRVRVTGARTNKT